MPIRWEIDGVFRDPRQDHDESMRNGSVGVSERPQESSCTKLSVRAKIQFATLYFI